MRMTPLWVWRHIDVTNRRTTNVTWIMSCSSSEPQTFSLIASRTSHSQTNWQSLHFESNWRHYTFSTCAITTIEHSTKWLATHLITSCSSSITYVITPTRTLSLETSKGYARHEQMPLIRRMHSLPLPTKFRLIEKHSWHDRLESLDVSRRQW